MEDLIYKEMQEVKSIVKNIQSTVNEIVRLLLLTEDDSGDTIIFLHDGKIVCTSDDLLSSIKELTGYQAFLDTYKNNDLKFSTMDEIIEEIKRLDKEFIK